MINLSVVQFNLVNPSVQVPNWWWAESSRGLIGTEGICISFIDIFALVERIRLIHLLFKQQLISLPILLSDSPVKLSFCGVSSLVIIYYWHCCAFGEATVTSFVVLTTLEFSPHYT